MNRTISPLDAARAAYLPPLPDLLRAGVARLDLRESEPTSALGDAAEIRRHFPRTYGRPALELVRGTGLARPRPLTVGVVLSGGQAPGGHNVVTGLFDGLQAVDSGSRLLGFLGGPRGVLAGKFRELTAGALAPYRNMGGFDLIGSGRDKIENAAQLAASRETCGKLGLDGLVIVGGDDSNTNAAVLAEYLLEQGAPTSVLGVPKTIDGDLKGHGIETSFGFDTATKVYSALIGNIGRDALSAGKYWHFIRLMGRSASHVTLECALQTHANVALIAEEIEVQQLTLGQVVDRIASVVRRRAAVGKTYGLCLIPEGLIEFVPDVRSLIAELNRILADRDPAVEAVLRDLSPESRGALAALPPRIRAQLLGERDAHGNVQVSQIDTEQLLIGLVADRLAPGGFRAQSHFFGYEGRSANPSTFDADYAYALGAVAALLVAAARTGYVCGVGNLAARPDRWTASAVPLTSLMRIERRKGQLVPVVGKALVRTDAEPFRTFAALRDRWETGDDYRYPGMIQYFGPPAIVAAPTKTLLLERTGSDELPGWLVGDGGRDQ